MDSTPSAFAASRSETIQLASNGAKDWTKNGVTGGGPGSAGGWPLAAATKPTVNNNPLHAPQVTREPQSFPT
jgi:hypothetical protein